MSEIEKMYENAGIKPIAEYCKHQCNNEFDEAIAGLINKLWQSLTEEEKQQVKGILE